jgi:hypothetical protein
VRGGEGSGGQTKEEQSNGEFLRKRIGTLCTVLNDSRKHWKHEESYPQQQQQCKSEAESRGEGRGGRGT